MAVLHHAFRCPMTGDLDREISLLLDAWERGDRRSISAAALAGYPALQDREDIHVAFSLSPDGPVSQWLQPEHISPGLAALIALAPHFIGLPGLSRSHDSNHHLLETQLPLLGWSMDEVALLVCGRPIEAMLGHYASTGATLAPGGFRYTGGWVNADAMTTLVARIGQLTSPLPATADDKMVAVRKKLEEYGAIEDAWAMLADIGKNDWLVTAITH